MTPQHAGRLIDAFEMMVNLSETLGSLSEPSRFSLPQRETHIRPLAALETPQQRAERKAGELLAQLEREPGERTDLTSSNNGRGSEYRAVLDETGTTRLKRACRLPTERL